MAKIRKIAKPSTKLSVKTKIKKPAIKKKAKPRPSPKTKKTTKASSPPRTYFGFVRDHSVSMSALASAAMADYNTTLADIKCNAIGENFATVVECGRSSGWDRDGKVVVAQAVSPLGSVTPLVRYVCDGGSTPLYDSVGTAIDELGALELEALRDKQSNTAFLLIVTTDGQENSSYSWSATRLKEKLAKLQATDRWTIAFRVPPGYKNALVQRLGIPEGNVLEWELSNHGIATSGNTTRRSLGNFFSMRASGQSATTSFFEPNMSKISSKTVKSVLHNISHEVSIYTVHLQNQNIRDFCENARGEPLLKGAAFYQLVKKEDEVQDHKLIVIQDLKTGSVYSGTQARSLLGLPTTGMVKVAPGNHSHYDIFIQSTSVNRKLPVGTKVLYWPTVGQHYKEGRSAW